MAAVFAAAMPALAEAGAWTRAEGSLQVIVTTAREVAPVGGWVGDVVTKDSSFSQVYIEYGLFDDLTVGGTLFVEVDAFDVTGSEASLGVFARQRLWQSNAGDVVSVQLGVSWPFEQLILDEFDIESNSGSTLEISARALYGRGFAFDWGNAFLNFETGYHWRETRADELRFDLSVGAEPVRGVLGILSVFTLVPLGEGTATSVKIAPSVAWTLYPGLGADGKKGLEPFSPMTLQVGVVYDILEDNPGLTLQVSIWRSF